MAAVTALTASAQCDWRGSMTPYPLATVTPALPDTLRPVGIVYVARHGARYLTSAKKVDKLITLFSGADCRGDLTERGRRFLRLLNEVKCRTDGRWGLLDSIGYEEERVLAENMRSRFPAFLHSGTVEARSTYVPRAIMTMYTFVYRLATLSPYLNIVTHEGPATDSLLRFFDTDTAFVSFKNDGAWKSVYDAYFDREVPLRPAEAMLNTHGSLSEKRMREVTMEAYDVLRSLNATGIAGDPVEYFTAEELQVCWRVSNLAHYLQRSTTRISALPSEAAAPLLKRIVADIDTIASGRSRADTRLYFGHAETLMPLLSLMRVEGCYAPDAAVDDVWRLWDDSQIVPLGANLEIDLARSRTGRLYVRAVLNGRVVSAVPGGGSVTEWQKAKSAWLSYL